MIDSQHLLIYTKEETMGRPCYLINNTTNERTVAPPCTDNFQIVPFTYEGLGWHSVVQCFQAAKFLGKHKQDIWKMNPYSDESDRDYGIRVWSVGKGNHDDKNPEWNSIKVHIMYLINRAKYKSNPRLQQQLLATQDSIIWGRPSTHDWQKWNGLIQMVIRDEIVESCLLYRDPLTSQELSERFQPYLRKYVQKRLIK